MTTQCPIPDAIMQEAAAWFDKPENKRFNVCRPSPKSGIAWAPRNEITREMVEEWKTAQQKASLL